MNIPIVPGYEGLEKIGAGGFGEVYRATQTAVGREVALKLLHQATADQDTERRFQRECRVVGSLSWHPHIAAVLDAGSDADGRSYLAFELLSGGSLGDRLKATGPIPWPEAVTFAIQMADALAAAHHEEVLHRDIKPDNILIDRLGRAKLADFGIAQMHDGNQTKSGIITATLAHVAPEILNGQRATKISDLYLLGSTLFQLIIGEPPFGKAIGDDLFAAMQRIASQDAPRLDERTVVGVPSELADVVERALRKNPDERFQSSADMGLALRAVQQTNNQPLTAMPFVEANNGQPHPPTNPSPTNLPLATALPPPPPALPPPPPPHVTPPPPHPPQPPPQVAPPQAAQPPPPVEQSEPETKAGPKKALVVGGLVVIACVGGFFGIQVLLAESPPVIPMPATSEVAGDLVETTAGSVEPTVRPTTVVGGDLDILPTRVPVTEPTPVTSTTRESRDFRLIGPARVTVPVAGNTSFTLGRTYDFLQFEGHTLIYTDSTAVAEVDIFEPRTNDFGVPLNTFDEVIAYFESAPIFASMQPVAANPSDGYRTVSYEGMPTALEVGFFTTIAGTGDPAQTWVTPRDLRIWFVDGPQGVIAITAESTVDDPLLYFTALTLAKRVLFTISLAQS